VNGRLLNVVASLVVVCVAVAAASYALVSSIAALTGSGG
jgi:hypothetical protein